MFEKVKSYAKKISHQELQSLKMFLYHLICG